MKWDRNIYRHFVGLLALTLFVFVSINLFHYSQWLKPYGIIFIVTILVFNSVIAIYLGLVHIRRNYKVPMLVFLIGNTFLAPITAIALGEGGSQGLKFIFFLVILVSTFVFNRKGGIITAIICGIINILIIDFIQGLDISRIFTVVYFSITAFSIAIFNRQGYNLKKSKEQLNQEVTSTYVELIEAHTSLKAKSKNIEGENEDLSKKLKEVRALYEISKIIDTFPDTQNVLNRIVNTVASILNVSICSIMLYDKERDFLSIKASYGLDDNEVKNFILKPGQGIGGWAFKNRQPVVVNHTYEDPRFVKIRNKGEDVRSIVSVPLWIEGKVVGVLNISTSDNYQFNEDEISIMNIVAQRISMVIENSRKYDTLEKESITEGMTGLYNYRYFSRCLDAELDRAKALNSSLSLVLLDIDKFKNFNDKYGHLVGDEVLVKIAREIKASIREIDIPCRYGGEEFAIILPGASFDSATMIAERIRKRVEGVYKEVDALKDTREIITISIGISSYPCCGDTKLDLIKIADQRMYMSKSAGGNRITVA